MIGIKALIALNHNTDVEADLESMIQGIEGINFGGGKGGSSVVEKPVYVPPPAPPAINEAVTQEEAVSPEEEMKRTKEALKQGAKSLQIPVTGGSTSGGTVGTGTSNT